MASTQDNEIMSKAVILCAVQSFQCVRGSLKQTFSLDIESQEIKNSEQKGLSCGETIIHIFQIVCVVLWE